MEKNMRTAWLVPLLSLLVLPDVYPDSYTLSTYYPAPSGVYENMTVTKELKASGLITGGGEEKVDLSGQQTEGKMAYDNVRVPFSCQAWGQAECPNGVAGPLKCNAGSDKVLTGVIMDNGISQIKGHGAFFVKWYLCVSQSENR